MFKTVTTWRRDDRAGPGNWKSVLALVLVFLMPILLARPSKAATAHVGFSVAIAEVGLTERIVIDRQSGVAIYGYDPVAYFTEGGATLGKPEFEVIWRGAAWRFINAGNMAAFMADPQVYAPQFGGYDPNGVARGVATAGDPRLFAIVDGRIYLFRDAAGRNTFVSAPGRQALSSAAWPTLERSLVE